MVYLGHRRYTRRTPTILANLYPGEYPVTLILKNHKSWSETLPVESGKATVLETILLLPEVWNQKTLVPETFDDLIPLEGGRFFLLENGSNVEDLFIYDLKEEKRWPLLAQALPGTKVSFRFVARGGPAFLLHTESKNGDQYLWFTVRSGGAQVRNLTNFFSEKPDQVDWDSQEKKYLFFLHDDNLNRIDFLSKAVTPKFLERVRSYSLSDKKLYVLGKDGILEQLNLNGQREKLIFQDPFAENSLFGSGEKFKIYAFMENFILLLGEKGELLSNRFPHHFVEDGVLGLEFYLKLKRILIWKRNALGILDLPKEYVDKESGAPKVTWILTQGERLEQAFWVYEGSHVIFRDKNKVFLMELETYAKPHLYFLTEVKNKSSIFYSEETGKLYFLDSVSCHLRSLVVLPRWEIPPLPFPERTEEKKEMELKQYGI